MDTSIKHRTMRIWFVWLALFALVAGTLVGQLRGRSDAARTPLDLGDVRLLQASTVDLIVHDNFPNVNLRAIVGPTGCKTGRNVTLFALVAGSTGSIPVGDDTTDSSGHALFTEIPNVEGTQYQAVADASPGCDAASSNIVTLEGPL